MNNQKRSKELPAVVYVRVEKDSDGTYFPIVELDLVAHADPYGETNVGKYGLLSVETVKLGLLKIKSEKK
jgi:hypothetical protein